MLGYCFWENIWGIPLGPFSDRIYRICRILFGAGSLLW